jgi:hypothetical protein
LPEGFAEGNLPLGQGWLCSRSGIGLLVARFPTARLQRMDALRFYFHFK